MLTKNQEVGNLVYVCNF